MFGSEFSGDILCMHGNIWPENFEIFLEDAKVFVAQSDADFTNFGPLSLCFENRILAHIISTTLVPRKGSLINISNRCVFSLKNLCINWALLFREYMFESSEDNNSSANLSYGLLISRIIIDSLVDLSQFKHVFIDVTYDTRTFSTMGYVLIDNK
ncbi:hypothetical protein AABB24_010416 [Solanum stoloniferum]|uniref:Uncharacterized protein n=1 Tax=Solanum stoloniferum TaxID=62892 RepID=A0ABD2U9M5_9SOLN